MNSLSLSTLHPRLLLAIEAAMLDLDDQQEAARAWFESLRDRICAAFEQIERRVGERCRVSSTRRGSAPM